MLKKWRQWVLLFMHLIFAHVRLATDAINSTRGKVGETQFNGIVGRDQGSRLC